MDSKPVRNNKKTGFKRDKRFNKPQFDRKNYNAHTGKKPFRNTDQLTENEVGISEFLSNSEGFTGVIKARFSDFHVSEVDKEGKVAVLTNTNIPKDETSKIDYESVDETPIAILPQDIWNDIKEMVKSNSNDPVKFDVTELNKDERKSLHTTIKGIFGNKIDSNTVEENDKRIVTFKKPTQGCRQRYVWPEGRGHYVHFILYKEALDTMTACYKVADVVKIKPSYISYAGIKDKRAKTTQWMCVRQVEPWKLITKSKPFKNIKIGNITFKDNPLKLGDLNGNRFKIALRNIVAEDAVVEKAIENVKNNGFINYYGLQRFGNDKEVPTFTVGVQLLLGNWKEACDLILKVKKSDEVGSDIVKAKKIYSETGDTEKAFNSLHRSKNNCVEAKLLQGLAKEKQNYVNALETIPRNMRLLYIHSFQSLIWNKMVSIRIKKYGLKPVVNDLVCIDNVLSEPEIEPIEEEGNSEEDVSPVTTETENEPEKQRQQVKALTESELSDYTIYDIVLPLPGYDVVYPENLKEDYEEELKKYGLTLEMPKQSVKTYTLSGGYRKAFGRIQDVDWKIMRYNDPNVSLILSDFDKLRKFEEPKDIPDGKFKAVILEFTLDSSVYATMVLREIMKIDTSPSAQVKMNDYANPPESSKIVSANGGSKKEENVIGNGLMHNSILNNKEKMEEFKRSIYGETTKRKNDESEDGSQESPKKQKLDNE